MIKIRSCNSKYNTVSYCIAFSIDSNLYNQVFHFPYFASRDRPVMNKNEVTHSRFLPKNAKVTKVKLKCDINLIMLRNELLCSSAKCFSPGLFLLPPR